MTCRECRDFLLEQFGGQSRSAEVSAHLESCAECRRLADELGGLSVGLGTNADAYPNEHDAELAAEIVEHQIRAGAVVTEVHRINWMRYAAVAAVIVLVSVSTVVWKMSDQQPQVITKVDTMNVITETTSVEYEDELSGGAVAALLEDYTGRGSFSAGEELLGDLTDEEAAYLEEQIKAGDLL